MKNKCAAIFDSNIITANLSIDYHMYQKFTKIDIDFRSVVGLEDKEFSEFLKTNWKNDGKTIRLRDVKKLYLIEKLQTHNQSLWSMFKKFGFACLGY